MAKRLNLNRLAHFVAIIEAGTITGAAARLGISKAVVSKQLQLLEEDVGTPLLIRNTRHLQPTAAGRMFYEDAKSALTSAYNAYERVQDQDNKPKGVLRITAPVDIGISYLAPFAARFQKLYPDVTFEISLTDSLVDIIEDRFDLAFRIGWLSDSANLAKKLGEFEEVAICSPHTYSKLKITEPKDLETVPFLRSQAFSNKTDWTFNKAKKSQTITTENCAEMNITLALKAYVTNAFCYTIIPDFLVHDELRSGTLKRLLPQWSLRKGGIYTVTPPSRVRSNALQKFLDMAHRKDKAGLWSIGSF